MTDRTIELYATIDGAEVDVTCAYDYHPYERQTYDYPGHPEVVTLYSVMDGNVEIFSALTPQEITRIEQQIIDVLHEDDGA